MTTGRPCRAAPEVCVQFALGVPEVERGQHDHGVQVQVGEAVEARQGVPGTGAGRGRHDPGGRPDNLAPQRAHLGGVRPHGVGGQ